MADPETPPPLLRCDVPGCHEEIAIRIGGEQRCYQHALKRGNELRASRGLPPVTVDEQGACMSSSDRVQEAAKNALTFGQSGGQT